ncbi:MAG: HIT family protein [Egibacteraceae bacterium]
MPDCLLCRGVEGDGDLLRVQVWSDELWRLTTTLVGEVAGFSYLEPKRHVRYIHELDGKEAATFGPVLADCSRAIKEVTKAGLVYVYVFGGSFDHLHLHLAPHVDGGPFNDCMLRGEVVEEQLANGAIVQTSKDFPLLPEIQMLQMADQIRAFRSR